MTTVALDIKGASLINVLLSGRAYQVDVTDQKHVKEVVDRIVEEFNGRLDIMVANAGIPWTQGSFLDGEIDHYRKVMATDMDSVYYCAYAAGQHWRRQKKEGTDLSGKKLENFYSGSFIATASMSGHIVNIPQLQAAYNGAKAAIIHFVKSIAVEMVGFARANTISPGYMATEISDFVPPETKSIWRDKIPMGREEKPMSLKEHIFIWRLTYRATQRAQTSLWTEAIVCHSRFIHEPITMSHNLIQGCS